MKKQNLKIAPIIVLLIFIVVMFIFDDNFQRNIKWDFFNPKKTNGLNIATTDQLFKNFPPDTINNAKIGINDFQNTIIGKDDIPSLISLNFDSATSTSFSDEEKIIGVYLNGEAHAYPYSILYWHEIINDTIAKNPISVTLCPLCNSTAVFSRVINGKITSFGVSGKLFNSCLIMHDRQTNSLWSQVWGMGVMGENNNYQLENIVYQTTSLGAWKKLHPNTLVLSTDTGYARNYNVYPYGNYLISNELRFSARNLSKLTVNPKDTTYYIYKNNYNQDKKGLFEGEAWHISKKEIIKKQIINFNFDNKDYKVKWDSTLETAKFYNETNQEIPSHSAFAFVYPAYFISTND